MKFEQLHYASAKSAEEASAVLFGANSRGAGYAPSHQTSSDVDRSYFSASAARAAENESPSLSEKLILGDNLFDSGDLTLPDDMNSQVTVMAERFQEIFQQQKAAICMGGDHLVKYAGISALSETHPDAYVLYIDAHPDCHQAKKLYYGSILHHAFQNLEGFSPNKVMLLGLRQATNKERIGFEHYQIPTIFGVDFSIYSTRELYEQICLHIPHDNKLYFSVDLDGLSPVDTPGVEQPSPGGPTLNQIIGLMHLLGKTHQFIGMDVTEFLPSIDKQKLTALAMARLVKEFASFCKK